MLLIVIELQIVKIMNKETTILKILNTRRFLKYSFRHFLKSYLSFIILCCAKMS